MSRMFGEIAPRYDFVTRTFSFGMDSRWKRMAVDRAPLPADAAVLDLACGTGDFSELVVRKLPRARSIAADLTEPMLDLARKREINTLVCADAQSLPFPSESFDCVFVGYGLRNFPNLLAAVKEIARVLRPGGCLVTLDFFCREIRFCAAFFSPYCSFREPRGDCCSTDVREHTPTSPIRFATS